MAVAAIKPCEWRVGPAGSDEIRVEQRMQRDGSFLYAVTTLSYTANRDNEWEREPIPSSRDDAYIAGCRFEEFDEAIVIALRMHRLGDRARRIAW